jgi:molybdate transport system permease protein
MTQIDTFPLFLSLRVAALASLFGIAAGIPAAWLLSRTDFRGKAVLDSMLLLPVVLPPSVLGYYLLVLLGRQSPLGYFLENRLGIELVFTWKAAVIAASVVSVPLLIKSARAAFESVDTDIENAARVLGKSELTVFFTVTLPLAWRGVAAGMMLAFARALGDFGATLIVAGNIPGKTQTMPIAIYDAILAGKNDKANMLVLVMTAVALIILALLHRFESRTAGRGKKC